ncbi:hypothetical protein ADU37_CDS20740 [Thermococcus sp. 2319x1]|nr:hypothetical protein ADU37_CDS20740 [Thermococcus sp. 2319x1]
MLDDSHSMKTSIAIPTFDYPIGKIEEKNIYPFPKIIKA